MTAEHDQEKWLHRLLRQRSATLQAAAPTSGCLDADALAAWADGALGAKELAAAESHVTGCPRCLALLAAIERTSPAVMAEPHAQRVWLRWLVPLTAAATALAIWVAVPPQQVIPVAREAASTQAPDSRPLAAPPVAAPQPGAPLQEAPRARADGPSAESRPAREERAFGDAVAPAESAPARDNAAAAQGAIPAPASPPAAGTAPSADALNNRLGATAERKTLSKESTAEDVASDNPFVRWRILSGTAVERSADGGKTWAGTSRPPASISSIRAVDALTATVSTADGRSFITTDGGATWAPVQEKPAAPF